MTLTIYYFYGQTSYFAFLQTLQVLCCYFCIELCILQSGMHNSDFEEQLLTSSDCLLNIETSEFSLVMLKDYFWRKGAYLKLMPSVGFMEKFGDPKICWKEVNWEQDEGANMKNSKVNIGADFIYHCDDHLGCCSFQMAVIACQFHFLPLFKLLTSNFMATALYCALSHIFLFVENLQIKCLDIKLFL